jgi:ribonuclease-3
MLRQALMHASAAPSRVSSNERLEFLGDAVLGMVICEEIYRRAPHMLEGEMTRVKSSVVSRQTCWEVARDGGMIEMLSLGKGVGPPESLPGSVGAAGFEALVGAIYLDGGLAAARSFILERMDEAIESAMSSGHQRNYKSLLQQYAQRRWNATPQYDLLDEKGPEHSKCFEVAASVNGRRFPGAWGNSKKQAEQKAALEALRALGVLETAEGEAGQPPVDEGAQPPEDGAEAD